MALVFFLYFFFIFIPEFVPWRPAGRRGEGWQMRLTMQ